MPDSVLSLVCNFPPVTKLFLGRGGGSGFLAAFTHIRTLSSCAHYQASATRFKSRRKIQTVVNRKGPPDNDLFHTYLDHIWSHSCVHCTPSLLKKTLLNYDSFSSLPVLTFFFKGEVSATNFFLMRMMIYSPVREFT